MARMRSVKPEFWADEDLAKLTRDARLLYIGLWNLADEHGRLRGDPRYIKGQLFPYDDDLDAEEMDDLLRCLDEDGKVLRYRVGGGAYVFLPNLAKHQRLESEKVPSRLPAPPGSDIPAPLSEPHTDEPEPHTGVSAPRAKDHALSMLHVAGGMEHVAAAAREPDSDPTPPERVVLEATDCTRHEARLVVEHIQRERKPRNAAALIRTIAQAGELGMLLDQVRAVERKAEVAAALERIGTGPPCQHGVPGGEQAHPTTGQPICPICRRADNPPTTADSAELRS